MTRRPFLPFSSEITRSLYSSSALEHDGQLLLGLPSTAVHWKFVVSTVEVGY